MKVAVQAQLGTHGADPETKRCLTSLLILMLLLMVCHSYLGTSMVEGIGFIWPIDEQDEPYSTTCKHPCDFCFSGCLGSL